MTWRLPLELVFVESVVGECDGCERRTECRQLLRPDGSGELSPMVRLCLPCRLSICEPAPESVLHGPAKRRAT